MFYASVRGRRRAESPPHPGSAAGLRAPGRRARERARGEPAGGLQAPAGPSGGRPGGRPPGGTATALPRPRGAAARDGRMARAVPGAVVGTSRRPRTAPRRNAGRTRMNEGGNAMRDGQLEEINGSWRLMFTRILPHAPEKVWRALTEPEHLGTWFPTTIEGELASGAALRFEHRNADLPAMEGEMIACEPPSLLE